MKIPTWDLVAIARATVPSMARTDNRYRLNGAHLRFKGGDLLVETTDGHRATQVLAVCHGGGEDFDIIIDQSSWLQVARIKTKRSDISQVTLTPEAVEFGTELRLPLRLIDSPGYPDLRPIIWSKPDRVPSPDPGPINAKYVMEAFRAANILADPRCNNAVKIVPSADCQLAIEVPTHRSGFDSLRDPARFVIARLQA